MENVPPTEEAQSRVRRPEQWRAGLMFHGTDRVQRKNKHKLLSEFPTTRKETEKVLAQGRPFSVKPQRDNEKPLKLHHFLTRQGTPVRGGWQMDRPDTLTWDEDTNRKSRTEHDVCTRLECILYISAGYWPSVPQQHSTTYQWFLPLVSQMVRSYRHRKNSREEGVNLPPSANQLNLTLHRLP